MEKKVVWERVVIKQEDVGNYVFRAYDADPYAWIEISLGEEVVDKFLMLDEDGPEWDKLKERYKDMEYPTRIMKEP